MSVSNKINDQLNITTISIEDEMKNSYLDYAMSVIVSRALPDVRDGLKPVHRRILYSMYSSSCDYNKPFRKSARIVGDVMGKFHPHGDSAIYDALVRMAQDFSLRVPLIDKQGNFGSIDGDAPASMRYTESRLAKISHNLLEDIDLETVEFHENYDASELEPSVLPSKFPNLLVNGANGIAVGMATNIPPHNLGEIIDACCAYIDNNDISFEELSKIVLGPDFPTAGIIIGRAGIMSAITKGKGSINIRGAAEIEIAKDGRQSIIITEIPYQVNKARMIEKIAELVKDKRIEGISDLRDESDKSGIRVVVELKKDVIGEVVLNQLYTYTPLQTSFGINILALDKGRPKVMNLKDILEAFINFREIVITKRTVYLLSKARDRATILIGFLIANSNIDEMIVMIKSSQNQMIAKEKLMEHKWSSTSIETYIPLIDNNQNHNSTGYLTESQAKAILDMRLHRLTGLEYNKIIDELNSLTIDINKFLEILSDRVILLDLLKSELIKIKDEFATPRLTKIEIGEWESDIEDLIQVEDMVVTVTSGGYIKRVPLSTYRSQKRGGKGRSGIKMRDEDITTEVFIANTHNPILFFSNLGKVYKLKLYKLPLGTLQSKGKALVNIFPLIEGEFINNIMALPEDELLWKDLNIIFATSEGSVRRNDLSSFHNINVSGKIAIKLEPENQLIDVKVCTSNDHILISSRDGKSIRFPVEKLRIFKSRYSEGVRSIRLNNLDKVISMTILKAMDLDMSLKDTYLKIPLENRVKIASFQNETEAKEFILSISCSIDPELLYKLAKEEEFILSITKNGFGKRTSSYDYRVTNRGGKGIINIITSERNGKVVASFPVNDNNQIMLISDKGTIIRCPVKDIRVAGRNTQGVMIFRPSNGEVVVSVAKTSENDEEIDLIDDNSDLEL